MSLRKLVNSSQMKGDRRESDKKEIPVSQLEVKLIEGIFFLCFFFQFVLVTGNLADS